jgi:predicted HTH domain antitoxin
LIRNCGTPRAVFSVDRRGSGDIHYQRPDDSAFGAVTWWAGDCVNVAIEIPDEIGRALAAQSGTVSRAVLEAVAAETYRSGAITAAQVQELLGLRSRWETEAFLRRTEALHDYTIDDLDRDIAAIRDASQR